MRKLTALVSAAALALVGTTAFAAPASGFGGNGGYTTQGPSGFANNAPQTVQQVLDNAYDDQRVALTGRLTNFLGHDRYEFTDNTGRIEVELDDASLVKLTATSTRSRSTLRTLVRLSKS